MQGVGALWGCARAGRGEEHDVSEGMIVEVIEGETPPRLRRCAGTGEICCGCEKFKEEQ